MKRILSPPPRTPTRAFELIRTANRRVSVMLVAAGTTLIVAGIVSRVPVPFCLWGVMALVGGVMARRSIDRRLELWLQGTEMSADAKPGKGWTLTWTVDGRTYTGQSSQPVLLWDNGRVRILVHPTDPSRMTPVGLEMVVQSESEGSSREAPTVLPSSPRASSDCMAQELRKQRLGAVLAFVLVLLPSCVVMPMVLKRRSFLSEAVSAGPARIIGRTAVTVDYECEGVHRAFEASGKAQSRWPIGTELRVYRREGRIVAEPELPGLPMGLGVVLAFLTVGSGAGILASVLSRERLARKLWRWGKEVSAEIVSDCVQRGRRQVICRYSFAGKGGIARREFAASRQPMEGRRGEAVVLVDPRSPLSSRVVLADEA